MKIYHFIILSLVIWLISCDPIDDRMTFHNRIGQSVFVKIALYKYNCIKETWISLSEVEGNSNVNLSIIGSWDSEFDNLNNSDSLIVLVFLNQKLQSLGYNNQLNYSDSLIALGAYKYKIFHKEKLVNIDWKIKFPDNTFQNGENFLFDIEECL